MFEIKGYKPEVVVKLDNGLYQFSCESATGKTRLCELLKEYSIAGENVVAYSYKDWKSGLDLNSVISRVNPKLVVIDRYDMFSDEYKDLLLELSEKAIVIIDSKEMIKFGEYDVMCDIVLSPDRIEVYG